MLEPCVILGIDPGLHIAGYAILKVENSRAFVVDFGYLKMDPKKTISERVSIFYSTFKEKIETFKVSQLALETPFLGKNVQAFLKLGYLRGILYLLANQNNLEIFEFSPKQVKLAVTGFGGASKEQVAMMILKMFPKINDLGKIEKNDVTDALAVTICGFNKSKEKLLRFY